MQPVSTLQRLDAAELHLVQRAGRVEKGEAVALDALEDEAFAAEEAGADTPRERDRDVDAARGAEKGILLRDDRAASNPCRSTGVNLSREGRREGDILPLVRRCS